MLKRFVAAGAPEEIIYQQKPHLGTDVLVGIVEKMRHEIEDMGGKFCFRSKVTDLIFENGALKEVEINNSEKSRLKFVCLLLGIAQEIPLRCFRNVAFIWNRNRLP